MTLDEFIKAFAAEFDDTPESDFTPETNYRQLEEWSSLIALSVIAMVEEEYDVTLKSDDIRNANTIKDLYNTINSKL